MPMTRYVPIAGTHAWRDGWCVDDTHPFTRMMQAHNFSPVRARDGRPFRWSTAVDGLFGDDREWQAGAEALYYFLDPIPYADRNLIAHSHGGQVAILCAAGGCPIRTLTTVGTPPRSDMPIAAALARIAFWQHVYDRHCDWWGWLGQLGEGTGDLGRRFPYSRVVNYGLPDVAHSKILRDEKSFHFWADLGLLANIESAGAGVLA